MGVMKMGRYDRKVDPFAMDKKGVTVVKCGCKIQKGCFIAANSKGEAVMSKSRFDIVGIALENGETGDMIKMQLY